MEGFNLINELPKKLDVEEQKELLLKRDKESRDKLILHNLRLIINLSKRYQPIIYDNEDLFSIGILALINAIDTFDVSKNIEFSTYASNCILNSFYRFFTYSKRKRDTGNYKISLDKLLNVCDENMKVEANYLDSIEKDLLLSSMNKALNDLERNLVLLYFGFNGVSYMQKDLKVMYGLSQRKVSVTIKKSILKLRNQLIIDGVFEGEIVKVRSK